MTERIEKFSKRFDSTLLSANATRAEIEAFTDRSIECDFRAITVPWYLMQIVVERVKGKGIRAACGVGFPLGFDSTEVKAFTIARCLELGSEVTDIDITANISAMKSGDWEYFKREIEHLSGLLKDRVCKVIIETPYLTPGEIIRASSLLMKMPFVDYVKTGTGYGPKPVTLEEVGLIYEVLQGEKKIKVSGGIKGLSQVEDRKSVV